MKEELCSVCGMPAQAHVGEMSQCRTAFSPPGETVVLQMTQIDRLRRTSPDPWKHRSDGMKCSTCIWYVAKNGPENTQEIGRCRRHAPTMSGYPVVFPVDWCGDHKLSEVRV